MKVSCLSIPSERDDRIHHAISFAAYFSVPSGQVDSFCQRAMSALRLRILDPLKYQPLRNCSRAGRRTVLRLQNVFHFLRGILASSDLKQRSGNDPYHIIEKRTVVFAENPDAAKDAKSCSPTRKAAASFIFSSSRG